MQRIKLFREAKTVGNTVGARLITEYSPETNNMKIWNETYDNAGNVNRIHIKSIDGVEIEAPHFPPTLKEKLAQNIIPTPPKLFKTN